MEGGRAVGGYPIQVGTYYSRICWTSGLESGWKTLVDEDREGAEVMEYRCTYSAAASPFFPIANLLLLLIVRGLS